MHEGFDDRGFPLAWETPPQRIVSLVPSLTETLVDLGAEEQIVGVTRFCLHPDHLRREKTRVGGTKGVKVDVIMDLRPDLVIANLEENEAQEPRGPHCDARVQQHLRSEKVSASAHAADRARGRG